MPNEQGLKRITLWLTLSKSALKSCLNYSRLLSLFQDSNTVCLCALVRVFACGSKGMHLVPSRGTHVSSALCYHPCLLPLPPAGVWGELAGTQRDPGRSRKSPICCLQLGRTKVRPRSQEGAQPWHQVSNRRIVVSVSVYVHQHSRQPCISSHVSRVSAVASAVYQQSRQPCISSRASRVSAVALAMYQQSRQPCICSRASRVSDDAPAVYQQSRQPCINHHHCVSLRTLIISPRSNHEITTLHTQTLNMTCNVMVLSWFIVDHILRGNI